MMLLQFVQHLLEADHLVRSVVCGTCTAVTTYTKYVHYSSVLRDTQQVANLASSSLIVFYDIMSYSYDYAVSFSYKSDKSMHGFVVLCSANSW